MKIGLALQRSFGNRAPQRKAALYKFGWLRGSWKLLRMNKFLVAGHDMNACPCAALLAVSRWQCTPTSVSRTTVAVLLTLNIGGRDGE